MKPVLFAALLAFTSSAAGAAELSVTDAFSRATPGAGPGVAYLTIHGGDTPDRLVSASTPRSAKVELHTMTMDGDVMRMREVDALDVPAGGEVKLAPGGMHLMLMGLAAPLKAGDTVPLTLHFDHAGDRVVEVPVGAIGATGPMAAMPVAGGPGEPPGQEKTQGHAH